MSVAWSYGVKLLSACILTQKTTWQSWGQRNEGREGRGWSLLKLAWLLKTLATLCNSILTSLSSSIGTAILSLYGEHEHSPAPKTWVLGLLYKGSIGTAVPAVVTWDPVCAADWFGLEHSLLLCHLGTTCFGNHSYIQELAAETVRLMGRRSSWRHKTMNPVFNAPIFHGDFKGGGKETWETPPVN